MNNIERYSALCHIHTVLNWNNGSYKFAKPIAVKYFDKEFIITEAHISSELVYCKTYSGIELTEDGLCDGSIKYLAEVLSDNVLPPNPVLLDMIEIHTIRITDKYKEECPEWPMPYIYDSKTDKVDKTALHKIAESIYEIALTKISYNVPAIINRRFDDENFKEDAIKQISNYITNGYFNS